MTVEGQAVHDLVEAIDRYLEAVDARVRNRTLAPLERRLERQLGTWWRTQARDVVRRLARYRGRFVTESVGDSELDRAWAQTVKATRARILPAFDREAKRALAAGIAAAVADVGITVDFDFRSRAAVDFLRAFGADHVARIDAATRDQLRRLLTTAADEGWSWTRTASEIRSRFDGFSSAATQAHLRTRAELVSVTELGDAYGAGHDLVRQHLAAQGLGVQKRWHTTFGDRVCPQCISNQDAGWISQTEPFPAGADREPQHPGCRCVTTTRVLTPEET